MRMLLALVSGLVMLAPVFGQAIGTANFAGTWRCPGQGQLVVTQDGGNLTVVFRGVQAEDQWGSAGRHGGTHHGTLQGQMATIAGDYGDGTRGEGTITLTADGQSVSGTLHWYRGEHKLASGDWQCRRE
jgi:hypothetical protein